MMIECVVSNKCQTPRLSCIHLHTLHHQSHFFRPVTHAVVQKSLSCFCLGEFKFEVQQLMVCGFNFEVTCPFQSELHQLSKTLPNDCFIERPMAAWCRLRNFAFPDSRSLIQLPGCSRRSCLWFPRRSLDRSNLFPGHWVEWCACKPYMSPRTISTKAFRNLIAAWCCTSCASACAS